MRRRSPTNVERRTSNGMVNILVTGGAGYLGSTLVPALLERGFGVTVVDNFMYGQDSLSACCYHQAFALVRGDVRSMDGDAAAPEAGRHHHPAGGAGRRTAVRPRSACRDLDQPAGHRRHARGDQPRAARAAAGHQQRLRRRRSRASSAPRRRRSGRCRSTAGTRSRSNACCWIGIRRRSASASRPCSACRRGCGSTCSSTISPIARAPIGSSCCSRATSSATSSTSATWRAPSCTASTNSTSMKGEIYNVGLSDANLSKRELCERIAAARSGVRRPRVGHRPGSRQARLHRVEREGRADRLSAGVLARRRHRGAGQGVRDDPQLAGTRTCERAEPAFFACDPGSVARLLGAGPQRDRSASGSASSGFPPGRSASRPPRSSPDSFTTRPTIRSTSTTRSCGRWSSRRAPCCSGGALRDHPVARAERPARHDQFSGAGDGRLRRQPRAAGRDRRGRRRVRERRHRLRSDLPDLARRHPPQLRSDRAVDLRARRRADRVRLSTDPAPCCSASARRFIRRSASGSGRLPSPCSPGPIPACVTSSGPR